MPLDVRGMAGHPLAALFRILRLPGIQVGCHGRFRVNDDGTASRKVNDHVRPHPFLLPGTGFLSREIAVLHHSRQFHHAAQLELSPLAANAVVVQSLGKPGGFIFQGFIAGKDIADLRFQVRIGAHAFLFHLSQPGLDQFQGFAHRLQHGLDGLFAGIQVMVGLLALALQPRFRQVQKLFLRVPEDFRADAGEGIFQHLFRPAEHLGSVLRPFLPGAGFRFEADGAVPVPQQQNQQRHAGDQQQKGQEPGKKWGNHKEKISNQMGVA